MRYPRFALVAVLALVSVRAASGRPQAELVLHFVEIGQGDCTLIECPNGGFILVDAGSTAHGDRDVVRDYVRDQLAHLLVCARGVQCATNPLTPSCGGFACLFSAGMSSKGRKVDFLLRLSGKLLTPGPLRVKWTLKGVERGLERVEPDFVLYILDLGFVAESFFRERSRARVPLWNTSCCFVA